MPAEAPVIRALQPSSFIGRTELLQLARVRGSSPLQRLHLAFCQGPPMTARQVAKPEIGDPNTDKIFDAITDGFEHTANLAIDSLSQDNAQADERHGVKSRNPCSLTFDKNSAQQFRRKFGVPRAIQGHFVFLLNFVTWMRQALCEISIICEKK